MDRLDAALAVAAVMVAAIGLLSKPLKRSPLQEPLVALCVGLAAGPYALGWVRPAEWASEHFVLELSARITLAIGLMGVALRIRPESPRALARPAGLLLTLGMAAMWALASLMLWWALGLPPAVAALIGACVTPTDPVVSSAIVTGSFAKRHLPRRVRDGLSLEAGANDGLSYLFVTLALLWLVGAGAADLRGWALDALLRGVGGGLAVGLALGGGTAWAAGRARRAEAVELHSFLSLSIALALAALSLAGLFGGDGLLAVFAAGLTFNLLSDRRAEHEEENVQEAVGKLFNLPMFVILGAALPLSAWAEAGWPLAAAALLVPLLRRLPAVLPLAPLMRGALNGRDVALMAWTGPVGVAAVYYAGFARAAGAGPEVWTVTSAVVAGSILVHGGTAAAAARIYAARPGPVPPQARPLAPVSDEERASA